MRVRYSRGEDVLLIELSGEEIDHAEEASPLIVHVSREGRPVVIEILDASEFLAKVSRAAMRAGEEDVELAL